MRWRRLWALAMFFGGGCAAAASQEQDGARDGELAHVGQTVPCCSAPGRSVSAPREERVAAEQVLLWLTLLQSLSPAVEPEPADDVGRDTSVPSHVASSPARDAAPPVRVPARPQSAYRAVSVPAKLSATPKNDRSAGGRAETR